MTSAASILLRNARTFGMPQQPSQSMSCSIPWWRNLQQSVPVYKHSTKC